MSIQEKKTVPLASTFSEISELLENMIIELELRGCQTHHPLIKRALAMQEKLKTLQ